MIKKLRRKFILIATLSVGITLFLIVGIINYTNYHRIDKNSDYILHILKQNKGNLPSSLPPNNSFPNFSNPITKETPFETRYFTVILNEKEEVIFTNTSKIASINEKQAINYTLKLVNKNKTSGYYHKFKYTTLEYEAGTMYIFLDCSQSINTFYNILIYSLIISLLGLILVFILVLILSKFLLKPAEESYQKQKVFITNASHDIKTPLTIINADTEVIEMENGSNDWTKDIKMQIEKLTSLTNKLVFLTKIDEKGYQIEKTDLNLSMILNKIVKEYKSSKKKIKTNIEKNINIKANIEMIEQLIHLLLDNAIQYSLSTIEISLNKVGKSLNLVFQNDVAYMENGFHNELFERFYRNDKSRNSENGGNGIGLSVVKSIVEVHKWKINCICTENKKIQFIINI